MKNLHSSFLSWNLFDFFKGGLVAIISAALTAALQMLTKVPPSIDWKAIGLVAATTAISYLLKQLVTNNEGAILTDDKENV